MMSETVPIAYDEMAVLVFALRYAADRHTYAPGLVCDYIKKQLPRMSAEQIKQLREEIPTLTIADCHAEEDINGLREALG